MLASQKQMLASQKQGSIEAEAFERLTSSEPFRRRTRSPRWKRATTLSLFPQSPATVDCRVCDEAAKARDSSQHHGEQAGRASIGRHRAGNFAVRHPSTQIGSGAGARNAREQISELVED